jgi:antitoxin component YwqK of YwqJK toxin-antitoxin module
MLKNGVFEEYYLDGSIKRRNNYRDGNHTGIREEYFENGKLSLLDGEDDDRYKYRKEYFETGQLKNESYNSDSPKVKVKNGVFHRSYHENGNVKTEKLFITNNVTHLNNYYENGALENNTINVGETYNPYQHKSSFEKSRTIAYHPNGQIRYKGKYDPDIEVEDTYGLNYKGEFHRKHDYNRKGLWIFFYENGMLEKTKCYNKGERDGYWIWYHSNGITKKINQFIDGKPDGFWIELKKDGSLFRWTEFKNDKVYNGRSISYDTRSHLSSSSESDEKNWIKMSELIGDDSWGKWYDEYFYKYSGVRDPSEYYDQKVKVKSEVSIEEGEKVGPEYKYNDNGDKRSVLFYEDGKLHGDAKLFHDNGKLNLLCHFKRGIQHGKLTVYHENKYTEEKEPLDFTRQSGDQVCNNDQGEMDHYHKYSETHSYLLSPSGKKLMKCEIYSIEGSKSPGINEGQCENYYSNGQILDSGIYINGQIQGIWTVYDKDGSEIGEGSYVNNEPWDGLIVGNHTATYITIGQYLKGEKIGEWNKFDGNGNFLNKIEVS